MNEGVRVIGGSSMGALRAAETAAFGTEGVGEIFSAYASGNLTDDDEVAVTHGDAATGYKQFSLPMVNIRATVELAVKEHRIDENLGDILIKGAKRLYFPERTLPRILGVLFDGNYSSEIHAAVTAAFMKHYVDVKRRDSIAVLNYIKSSLDCPPPTSLTSISSGLFDAIYERDRTARRPTGDVSLASIANFVALTTPDFDYINDAALNRALVQVLAALLEVKITAGQVKEEEERFRLRRGLTSEHDLATWRFKNNLSEGDFERLIRERAVLSKDATLVANAKSSGKKYPSRVGSTAHLRIIRRIG